MSGHTGRGPDDGGAPPPILEARVAVWEARAAIAITRVAELEAEIERLRTLLETEELRRAGAPRTCDCQCDRHL